MDLTSHQKVPLGNDVVDLRSNSAKIKSFNDSISSLGIPIEKVTFIYHPDTGLVEFDNYTMGRNKIKKNRGPYARRGEIAAVSVKFMKGLESDIVAIVGIDGMNEAEKYVALTRSKNLIYLL